MLFTQLRELAQAGELELQINSIVKGEVQKHISKTIKDTSRDLNKILSSRQLHSFSILPEYAERMKTLSPNDWANSALEEFRALLEDCKTEILSSDNIDVERIVSDYFELRWPFEQSKKDEFPDAITVLTIAKSISELSNHKDCFPDYETKREAAEFLFYCIVSNDKGFQKAIVNAIGNRPNEDVLFFNSLQELINFITTQNDKASALQKELENGFASEIINTAIVEGVSSATFSVEEQDGFVEDTNCVKIDDYRYDPYLIDIQPLSDGTIIAKVYVDAQFKATLDYAFFNTTESVWDKEDRCYLLSVVTDKVAIFQVHSDLSFTIMLGNDGEAEFVDYLDIPTEIDVFEDDLIEVISYKNRDLRC